MTDFALATVTEFCQSGSISEINSAILLYRQVIHTRKPSDSKSLFSMYRLAGALALRWFHSRRHGDLDEAVSLLQDCLRLPPAIQPDQPQPALLVLPVLGRRLRHGAVRDVAHRDLLGRALHHHGICKA